jgi:hypothetical protein
MMQNGELFQRQMPSLLLAIRARITCGNASGLSLQIGTPTTGNRPRSQAFRSKNPNLGELTQQLPTPTARDWRSGKASEATMQRNSRPLSEKVGGLLNPQWVEWLMGWPIGQTDLEPLATDKFQQWRRSHGDC